MWAPHTLTLVQRQLESLVLELFEHYGVTEYWTIPVDKGDCETILRIP